MDKLNFAQYDFAAFQKTDYPYAYAKIWFDWPVYEYIYAVKDTLGKDLFPFNDSVVYKEYELRHCQELLSTKSVDEAESLIRKIHYLIRNFGGTIQKGSSPNDPDPTRKHTPDSKYWIRLYEYLNHYKDREILREITKTLRQKGFIIAASASGTALKFYKPAHIEEKELENLIGVLAKYQEKFYEALYMIEDCSDGLLRKMAAGGVI